MHEEKRKRLAMAMTLVMVATSAGYAMQQAWNGNKQMQWEGKGANMQTVL